MKKIKTLHCYNLVNADGRKLLMYLGRINGYNCDLSSDPDKGYRWMFVGGAIPMPVRSNTWFNGFPESIMLDWLKGNGWVLRSSVSMATGKATVFDLPKESENDKDWPIHYEQDEPVFLNVIRSLMENRKPASAARLYRFCYGGSLANAKLAVDGICNK